MYLVREKVEDGEVVGYYVDEKISGKLIETHFVDSMFKTCSCKYFQESNNPYNHFHINLCKFWVRSGKPMCALYGKSRSGKIVTLCAGFLTKR